MMLSKTEDQWSSLELKALRNSTDHDGVSAVVRNQIRLRLRSLGSGTSEHRGLPKVRSGSKAKTRTPIEKKIKGCSNKAIDSTTMRWSLKPLFA